MPKEATYVASLAEIPPGRMFYTEIDGLPIALANVDGTIYAFSDSCRHEGGPLSAGVLIDDTVTCPWHGWTYSVRTGKAIVPPIGLRTRSSGSFSRACHVGPIFQSRSHVDASHGSSRQACSSRSGVRPPFTTAKPSLPRSSTAPNARNHASATYA